MFDAVLETHMVSADWFWWALNSAQVVSQN